MIVRSQDFRGSGGEVDGLPPQMSVLAPGEREQRFEQAFLPLAGGDDAFTQIPQGGRVCVRVGECDLGERELEGDLAAQLVSGVGDEAPVRVGAIPGCVRRHRPTARSARTAQWIRSGPTVYCPATNRATVALVITRG